MFLRRGGDFSYIQLSYFEMQKKSCISPGNKEISSSVNIEEAAALLPIEATIANLK